MSVPRVPSAADGSRDRARAATVRFRAVGPQAAGIVAELARRIHAAPEAEDETLSVAGWRRLLELPAIRAWLLCRSGGGKRDGAREGAATADAEGNEIPVGFFMIQKSGEDVEIVDLGLVPEVRGEGLGNMLMNRIETICRAWNAKRILLEVREGNNIACKLYQNRGFSITGRRVGYYASSKETREDALLMELRLM